MPKHTLTSGVCSSSNPALRFTPTCDPLTTRVHLHEILLPGVIRDRCLQRHIERLRHRFLKYASFYPYGLWAPGLIVNDEMRTLTETYLPMVEMDVGFRRLFELALRYRPLPSATTAGSAAGWLDFVAQHRSTVSSANPAHLLESLCCNETFRVSFLFEHFLPRRHGGGFNRYPRQLGFLKCHLEQKYRGDGDGIRCLDAACGTGEGTYDLAGLLRDCGIPVARQGINGSTIEPLELFAAAHGFFPHDPARETNFRSVMRSLMDDNVFAEVGFQLEDISFPSGKDATTYDVIVCNGLLGGPALHVEDDVMRTVAALAGRLRPGGILLAADRFHGGWKKNMPSARLMEMVSRCGLNAVIAGEGIAAVK